MNELQLKAIEGLNQEKLQITNMLSFTHGNNAIKLQSRLSNIDERIQEIITSVTGVE